MLDTHDRRLLSHVRPAEWRNPAPKPMYDLVVIGGGTAGLVCAAGAAGLGARVALVERALLGGDCLNTGCVPSKALLRSARVVSEARAGNAVGVNADAHPDFAAVMSRLRARRADLAPHDSAARLAALGVDVFFGQGAFAGKRSITVHATDRNGRTDPAVVLHFRRAVIATGSRPTIPPIPALADVPLLTSENLFSLTEQPRELVALGGGPIGCEMAQAFALLGTRVTLIEAASQILPREDADAAELIAQRLTGDGVDVRVGVRVLGATRTGNRIEVTHERGQILADAVLVATGRTPIVDGLNLAAVDVAHGPDGVQVDDRLRTTNPHVFAAGDVCSRFKFTHAADAMARIVIQNALFFGRRRAGALIVPWCTFTSPQLAHVGLTRAEAEQNGAGTITLGLSSVDRAVVDESGDGFVRVHHRRGRIVGATIVAPDAGELIGVVAYAMHLGRSLGDFSSAILPYPTLALALKQVGDSYRRTSVTPAVRRLLHYYFSTRRWLPFSSH